MVGTKFMPMQTCTATASSTGVPPAQNPPRVPRTSHPSIESKWFDEEVWATRRRCLQFVDVPLRRHLPFTAGNCEFESLAFPCRHYKIKILVVETKQSSAEPPLEFALEQRIDRNRGKAILAQAVSRSSQ